MKSFFVALCASTALVLTMPAQAAVFQDLSTYNASASGDTVAPDVVITPPAGVTVVDTFVTTQPDTPPSSLDQTNAYLDGPADTSSTDWNFTFKSGDNPLGNGTTSGTVTSAVPTSQWLLKFGDTMLVILLSAPTTSLTFSGLDFGLSHYDTGSGGPNPIPVPGAVWLFGTGLAGLYGLHRRRSKKNAKGEAAAA